MSKTINDYLTAIKSCKNTNSSKKVCIKHYENDFDCYNAENQFIIIIKPECCASEKNVDVRAILKHTLQILKSNQILIHSSYAMNGRYINERDIIENQYYVLHRGARFGKLALPDNFIRKLYKRNPNAIVIGAYKFLRLTEEFTAKSLSTVANTIGSLKMGNGTYILELPQNGQEYQIINAFHPQQLNHFCSNKSTIVVLECLSNMKYSNIATDVIGFFVPEKASKKSLRYFLYERKNQLRMNIVNVTNNGFHISPSPLEGLFGVRRYCEMKCGNIPDFEHTSLGKKLIDIELSQAFIYSQSLNPFYDVEGKVASIFDLTEGLNSTQIIRLFKTNKLSKVHI